MRSSFLDCTAAKNIRNFKNDMTEKTEKNTLETSEVLTSSPLVSSVNFPFFSKNYPLNKLARDFSHESPGR